MNISAQKCWQHHTSLFHYFAVIVIQMDPQILREEVIIDSSIHKKQWRTRKYLLFLVACGEEAVKLGTTLKNKKGFRRNQFLLFLHFSLLF